ncbi:MAG: rhodanese-like domain-containing protein [Nanoarchaeota archaeon]
MHCHTGARSAAVLQMLKNKGFKNLKNLVGGIDAWSNEIDPEVPVY